MQKEVFTTVHYGLVMKTYHVHTIIDGEYTHVKLNPNSLGGSAMEARAYTLGLIHQEGFKHRNGFAQDFQQVCTDAIEESRASGIPLIKARDLVAAR